MHAKAASCTTVHFPKHQIKQNIRGSKKKKKKKKEFTGCQSQPCNVQSYYCPEGRAGRGEAQGVMCAPRTKPAGSVHANAERSQMAGKQGAQGLSSRWPRGPSKRGGTAAVAAAAMFFDFFFLFFSARAHAEEGVAG